MKALIPYTHEFNYEINLTDKPACGAETRSGKPCRRAPMENGKCSNHGGKSLGGRAHPNYKHGRYSKYSGRNWKKLNAADVVVTKKE